jgi:fumarate reductase subunit D
MARYVNRPFHAHGLVSNEFCIWLTYSVGGFWEAMCVCVTVVGRGMGVGQEYGWADQLVCFPAKRKMFEIG